jgi:hypothetical protein
MERHLKCGESGILDLIEKRMNGEMPEEKTMKEVALEIFPGAVAVVKKA